MTDAAPLPGWVDNHCHLPRGDAAVAVVEAAVAAGVTRLVDVGTDAERAREAIAQAARHPGRVWATVGLHPHDASHGVATLDGLFDEPGVVAVGECGLDFHYDHSPRDVQRRVFAEQIAIANERGLPLVIHTREAWEETFDILDREGLPARTVFHCFTGGVAEARAALERGAFLSFSGIITFPSGQDLRDAAAICPIDRVMVETDSPYLAPVPFRGKQNQPANVVLVGGAVAAAMGRTTQEVAEATSRNAVAFYGLD